MDALGFEEYFYGDGVTVVEWADKIEGLLPAEAITVRIAYGPREDQRVVRGSIPQAMPERKP
jgi:tRNA threonylcarbamoyladenosine biosynthesis protein TsaE